MFLVEKSERFISDVATLKTQPPHLRRFDMKHFVCFKKDTDHTRPQRIQIKDQLKPDLEPLDLLYFDAKM